MNKIFHLDNKNSELLFVYGTLMHPRTRDFVLKHKESASKGLLPGYKRDNYKTPDGDNFRTVTPAPFSKVSGDVLKVTKEDLEKLKTWENQYSLEPIKLANGMDAFTFILKKRDELKKE
jgi:gamma-glutamylcyclotransferase (GGCT)/AIG2-like uncharacterized protein YtfP